jgi:hypothetical protein
MNFERSDEEQKEVAVLYSTAELLRSQYSETGDLVRAVGKFIHEHALAIPDDKRIQPKSMMESRFTYAEDAFAKGMVSCGAMATVSAEMLKHVGLQVKLVHGETDQSVDHAWISVLNPETNEWEQYDLTQQDGAVTPGHVTKLEADSWEDIREQIEGDSRTTSERQKEQGIK